MKSKQRTSEYALGIHSWLYNNLYSDNIKGFTKKQHPYYVDLATCTFLYLTKSN